MRTICLDRQKRRRGLVMTIPKGETSLLTAEEMLRRASALIPVLKERAAKTEEMRKISRNILSL